MSTNGVLKVLVISCTNIPGSVNPYVSLLFQGTRKKIAHKKSDSNPVWNEKLDFDLKGNPLTSSDTLEVDLKGYETIGADKIIGTGTISLSKIFSINPLKSNCELFDAQKNKLSSIQLALSIEYIPPSSTTNQIFEDDNESGINEFKRKDNLPRSTKNEDFQIRIKVFEARQLDGNNISPMVRIKCSNMQKTTKTIRSTNNPYWDEIFFFNFHISQAELFDQSLDFSVYNTQGIMRDSLIGSFKMDIGYIYDEPQHSIISKWLLLADPEDMSSGSKGYLKVTVNVLGTGDEAPPKRSSTENDDIETNLLKPAGQMLRNATFAMKLYKAEDLPRMDSALFEGVKGIFGTQTDKKELIDPYVVFSFAGKKVTSKIIYNNSCPEWNQELKLGLKFPSMCDKISIAVRDWDRAGEDDYNCVYYLPINSISDLGSDGFLPTFGPCYINLYGAPREFSDFATKLDELNLGKGEGVAYRGRILLEIQTILGELPIEPVTNIKHVDVLKIEPLLHRKKYKLHAAFLNATMISEIEKPVEFEISMGNYGNKLDENVAPSSSTTPPCNPVFDGCSYYYLPWGDFKPCMQVTSFWEDISFRIDAINQIKKIRVLVNNCLSTIKFKLQLFGSNISINSPEVSQLAISMIKSIENIKNKAKAQLPQPIQARHHPNELDRFIFQSRVKALKLIVQKCNRMPNLEFDQLIDELESCVTILQNIEKEPQNSIPDIIIWMLCGNERKAYYRIPANEIMFSSNPDLKGELCGKLQSIILKWPGPEADVKENRETIPGQIRVKLWLGFESDEKDWIQTHASNEYDGELSTFAETYENQEYSIVGFGWANTGLSRPSFSDSSGKIAMPKEAFKLPSGWEWDGDWYISPEVSTLFEKDSGHSQFMEEVFEQNTRTLPGSNWENGYADKKPFFWSDIRGDKSINKDEFKLKPNWKWDDEWSVDTNRAVDNEGWEYCIDPTLSSWSPTEKLFHLYRRRRWIRNRSVINFNESNDSKKKDIENALKEGWEYAKMWSMKFHFKEESSDTVRRRRWHRAMKPIDENANLSVVFTFKDTKQSIMNLNAPRIFLKYNKPNKYQLRAHIYQARSLPASDNDTSLSDPFCHVIFMSQSMKTEIIKRSLSPTWDQTLIFDSVDVYGNPDELMFNPPNIIIEVFDHDESFMGIGDKRGNKEFLGRCMVKPTVKTDSNLGVQSKLQWIQLKNGEEDAGELLACFELFSLDEKTLPDIPSLPPKTGTIYRLPSSIRPELQRTMIEILAWGLRNMKSFQLSDVDKPQIIFECGDRTIETEIIKNLKKNPNFSKPVIQLDIMLPKEEIYIPPMNIKVLDHRHFGRKPIVGVHVIKNLTKFRIDEKLKEDFVVSKIREIPTESVIVEIKSDNEERKEQNDGLFKGKMKKAIKKRKDKRESKFKRLNSAFGTNTITDMSLVEEDIDWWCKYYASLGEIKKSGNYLSKGFEKLEIYNDEIESLKIFNHFTDFCDSFELIRGKTTTDEEFKIVGELKGMFKIYPIDESEIITPDKLLYKNVQTITREECVIRVYVVKGIELQPKDSNGKSDPYIQVEVGKTKIDSRDNYIPNTVNPEFGRMFELNVILPFQKDLFIRVFDYDMIGSDDLIGETRIDLENRLLTKHRATCGLPAAYNESGPNKWRDSRKPSEILEDLFKKRSLNYVMPTHDNPILKIQDKLFSINLFEKVPLINRHLGPTEERLCLHVLNSLNLVPEHVETRRLYNPAQPGMEQGRLQMWVDIFPKSIGLPGPVVDISPRKTKKFVLRCIIWNTAEVPCDDISITGERTSDIYLKGWLQGLEEDKQETDIHYNSMNGDGNFNWRFTFDFDYLTTEQNLVVKKKEHFWSLDETEIKIPPVLTIQVWDNDKFSADDFLGQLSLNLNQMIRPVKDSSLCGLHQLPELPESEENDDNSKKGKKKKKESKKDKPLSLFEARRLKGWWPCIAEMTDGSREMAGKVEMELEILTEEEATDKPAGRAREEPNQNPFLEIPVRPDTSVSWFVSPLKIYSSIWKRYKWYLLTAFILVLLLIFVLLMFYSLPGALWTYFLTPK